MTTAATAIESHLDRRWPALLFERYNCRPIAGSTTWSQHSWPGGNARDIFGPDKLPSPTSQALLDVVYYHLRANQQQFGIKTILWRIKDHFNHIHVDMWPTGYSKPPCGGGSELYRYSGGRIVEAVGGIVPPEGTFEEGTTMTVNPGESGNYVRVYQQALNGWAVKQAVPNWTVLDEDGIFGPLMESAVSLYQRAAQVDQRVPKVGALDDLTRDLLERFVEA